MSKPPFREVERLFHEALALPAGQRPAFLETACAGDADLRAAVEELLRHDDDRTESFLASPVAHAADQLRPPEPTLTGLPPGTVGPPPCISGYELLEELGRGGMGVVYKVRQTGLNRVVALKMLLPGDPAAPASLERFRAEAEALARLQHRNIITIYDIGEYEGRPYFTMEYVTGPSLARVLDGRPQGIADSARLIETLARTMHVVHQHGIIHRDLKPANILLSGEGRVAKGAKGVSPSSLAPHPSPLAAVPKITDFGLAKDRAAARKLTQSGTAMGTPSYMAPEQARAAGGDVGPAADIYALGSILYELLTGRPPFEGDSPAETIARLLNDEPLPPSRLRPKLPRDLTTICLKCLEKSPGRRYASAEDLAEDLRRFLAGEPIRARPVGPLGRAARWCRRHPVTAGLLLLSGLLAVGLVVTVLVYNARLEEALARAERTTEEQRLQLVQFRLQLVQLNVSIGINRLEAGDTFAAVLRFTEALRLDEGSPGRERNHRTRIATALRQCPRLERLRAEGRRVLCTHLGDAGGWVATVDADNTLRVSDVRTGRPAGPALPLDDAPVLGALGPDGRRLATVGAGGTARVWDLSNRESEELPCRGGQAVRHLALGPEGRVLLTWHADATVRLWDLTTRPLTLPRPLSGGAVACTALSDSGRWLFTLGPGRVGRVWDVAARQAVGPLLKLERDVTLAAVSPDGRRVALLGPGGELRVWDVAAGKGIGLPMRPGAAIRQAVFSPDGERLVTLGGAGQVREWQVRTGEQVASWPGHGGAASPARFSPDGRRLITCDDAGRVCVRDATTGRALTPPLRHGRPMTAAAFCAEGKEVAAVSGDGTVSVWELAESAEAKGDTVVAEVGVVGGARLCRLQNGMVVQVPRALTSARLRPPRAGEKVVDSAAFSPDGGRVVVLGEDGQARVWDTATGAPLTGPLRHKGAVWYAAFSPDGSRLITAGEERTARVWDARTGEALTPPLPYSRTGRRALFSADGNRAVVVQEGAMSTWDLTPEVRPVAELVTLARVLACARINELERPQALEPHELRASWESLRVPR
jgi:WD40 repeat protein